MKVPLWTALMLFRAVYKWAALVLYNDVWIDREITALEVENLITRLADILQVEIKYDSNVN